LTIVVKLSKSRKKPVYDYPLGIRITWETLRWLEKIALFEHLKVTELVRKWISDQILKYQRNPQFKAFLKQLEKGER